MVLVKRISQKTEGYNNGDSLDAMCDTQDGVISKLLGDSLLNLLISLIVNGSYIQDISFIRQEYNENSQTSCFIQHDNLTVLHQSTGKTD